jgi:RimJ/RimL family protein N-acetyltransferase
MGGSIIYGGLLMPGDVLLRDVIDSDLPIFYEHQHDPEATTMAAFPARGREAFMAHWVKIMADPAVSQKTILFDGQVAGNIVVFGPPDHREVGYWIGREYWDKGIATQALRACLEQVKERPLYAHVAEHIIGSRRVLENCGFTLFGEDYVLFEGRKVKDFVLILGAGGSGDAP